MNRVNFQQTGGFPLETDSLDFMQSAYEIFNTMADVCGNYAVLKGCVVTGSSVSDGVVAINGEVLFFKGGSLGSNVIIKEDKTSKPFEDGSTKEVFRNRYVTFGTSSESILWSTFKRIKTTLELSAELAQKATDTALQALANKVTILERLCTPMLGKARIWWTGTIQQLATECPGWEEDISWRERFAFHWNPNNTKYKNIGDGGGQESVALSAEHNGPHEHSLNMRYTGYRHSDGGTKYTPIGEIGSWLISERDGSTDSSGQGKAHDNMPPFKIGMWIKYVG